MPRFRSTLPNRTKRPCNGNDPVRRFPNPEKTSTRRLLGENFNIETLKAKLQIGWRLYAINLYQANFYPLNAEPVTFQTVGLKTDQVFLVAKNPSFFGQNRQRISKCIT